jgi:hypothetical protein
MDGVGGIGTEGKKELQRKESRSSVSERNVGGRQRTIKKVLKDWRYNRKERRKMEN